MARLEIIIKPPHPASNPVVTYFGADAESSPPDAAKYFEMIGRIVALWGRIEMTVNQLVSRLHIASEFAGTEYHNKPRHFGRKVKFLRFVFAEFIEFTPLQKEFERLSRHIVKTADFRAMLNHYTFFGFRKRRGVWAMAFRNTEQRSTQVVYVTLAELTKRANEAGHIGLMTVFFSAHFERVVRTIVKETPPTAEA